MRLRAFAPLALCAGLLACESGPGELVFQLATPNQDDGAIQFTIRATEPATVSAVSAACTGCEVFSESVSDTEIRGVLIGTVVAGPALRVTVSDRGAQGYSATVVAAASQSYALRNAGGYALTPAQ
jgi:hypothetical protein